MKDPDVQDGGRLHHRRGAGIPEETIINSIRSRQFPRTGPSILPNLAAGIPRDAYRPAMAVLLITRDDIRGVTGFQ